MPTELDQVEMQGVDVPADAPDRPLEDVLFPELPDTKAFGGPLNKYAESLNSYQKARRLRSQAILLLREQGYSRKEIGKLCGMTPNAVRQALTRARREGKLNELRSILENDSLALAIESLNHHLLAKDKDATFKTLEGLGQFRAYNNSKHEGTPGFTMPALTVNVVAVAPPAAGAPAGEPGEAPLGVPREDRALPRGSVEDLPEGE